MRENSWDHSIGSKIAAVAVISLTYVLKFLLYRHLTELDACLSVWQSVCSIVVNIGAALAVGALTIMPRRRWIGFTIMLLLDIWLLFNTIYFLANGLLPDWQVLTLVSQLWGFERALLSYFDWRLILFPLLSIAGVLFLYALNPINDKPMLRIAAVALLCGITLQLCGVAANKAPDTDDTDTWSLRSEELWFMKSHSAVGHAFYALKNALTEGLLRFRAVVPLTDHEREIMSSVLGKHNVATEPRGHLVFILVESLETWAIDATDVHGLPVCPNITQYISRTPVLYCPAITTQQQYGRSGDGQLITQTGLLPLMHGVACMQNGDNVYPNFAHFYADAVVVNGYSNVWNQHVTTYSYGYKRLIEPRRLHSGSDKRVLEQLRQQLENADTATCVLALTIDTHAPFKYGNDRLQLADEYSATEKAYLRSVSRFDSLLGEFIAWADTAQNMNNATIVITADHNHFPQRDGKGLCPLIIKSPEITENIRVDKAWQMDIFPTVLYAIGQHNYCWHGFGINLITKSQSSIRITPSQALTISDKLIRTDYFKNSDIAHR